MWYVLIIAARGSTPTYPSGPHPPPWLSKWAKRIAYSFLSSSGTRTLLGPTGDVQGNKAGKEKEAQTPAKHANSSHEKKRKPLKRCPFSVTNIVFVGCLEDELPLEGTPCRLSAVSCHVSGSAKNRSNSHRKRFPRSERPNRLKAPSPSGSECSLGSSLYLSMPCRVSFFGDPPKNKQKKTTTLFSLPVGFPLNPPNKSVSSKKDTPK